MTPSDNQLPENIRTALGLDAGATAEHALQLAEQRLKVAVDKLATLPAANPQRPKWKKDRERMEPIVAELLEMVHGRRVDEICDLIGDLLSKKQPGWIGSTRVLIMQARNELINLPAGSSYHRREENLEGRFEKEQIQEEQKKGSGETKVVTKLETLIDDGLLSANQEPPDIKNAEKCLAEVLKEAAIKPVPDKLKRRLDLLKTALERARRDIARSQLPPLKEFVVPMASVKEPPPTPATAPVKDIPRPATPAHPQRFELHASDGTRIFVFNQIPVRIGRHSDCEILARMMDSEGQELWKESISISKYHALIEWNNDRCRLKDGGQDPKDGWRRSSSGLWVDGRRVAADGDFNFVAGLEHRITLGDPGVAGARRYELSARLWLARDLAQSKTDCLDVDPPPQSPACLMLRRLNGPAWVYLVLRSCAALAWADSRCGSACVGLCQGSLHLCEGRNSEPLVAKHSVRAGSLKFEVISLLSDLESR